MESNELATILVDCVKSIRETLSVARSAFAENAQEFTSDKFGIFFNGMKAYGQLLSSAGCKTYEELEEKIKTLYSKAGVRDGAEELLALEEEWDEFLGDVDLAMTKPTPRSEEETIELVNIDNEDLLHMNKLAGNANMTMFILLRHFA